MKPLAGLATVGIEELRPAPGNPREHLTEIEDLAISIRENGLIQPLVVQKVPGFDGYQIVAGHRRFAAILLLGWATCPCVIRRDLLPDEELLAMLVENGQRAALDPIEEARALGRLRRSGLTTLEIARRIGRPSSFVLSRLALLGLPAEEQEELRAGTLGVTRALATAAAARQQVRLRQAGRAVGRPRGAKTKPYFGDTHPLAKTVRARCDHRGTPKVGSVGCGACWEAAIREDVAPYATGYAAEQAGARP